jgi:signal transduction histidine kinase
LTQASSTRRYTVGVLAVGAAGVLLLAIFLRSLGPAVDAMLLRRIEAEARLQAQAIGEIIRARLEPHMPTIAPLDWARHQVRLEGALAHRPELRGAVLWQGGVPVCVVPAEGLEIDSRASPPGAGGGLRIRVADQGRAVAAFIVAPDLPVEDPVIANVFLQLVNPAAERERLVGLLTWGVIVAGVVVYLLAALAMLMSRAQVSLVNREREKSNRLRAIAEVAGGIAHEVRNPLNAISLTLQYIQRMAAREGKPPREEDLARSHLELGKIRKVVDNFVNFARTRDLVVEQVELRAMVEEALEGFAAVLEERGIGVEASYEGSLSCRADREKLGQVLRAVIANAVEAMSGGNGGELKIRVRGERGRVRVVVRDSGEVLDEKVVGNIFEPYFTTRDHAMGLGMTVARTLVESHGGTIEAATAQGGGCVVTITLPRRRV